MESMKTDLINIFRTITKKFWDSKIEQSKKSIRDAMYAQSLKMNNVIQASEAMAKGIQKEKFLVVGTVGEMVREQTY